MRAAGPFLLFAVAACACGGRAVDTNPNHPTMPDERPFWSGPAVRGENLSGGALAVHLIAPTGGCALELVDVLRAGTAADVRLVYRTPGDALVPQVLTPLRVDVPGERLGSAKQVRLWVAIADGAAAMPGGYASAAAFGR